MLQLVSRSGEKVPPIPETPVHAQRAADDAAADPTLRAALSRAYGWNHELRPAEIRLGVAGGSRIEGYQGDLRALGLIEEAIGKRTVGVSAVLASGRFSRSALLRSLVLLLLILYAPTSGEVINVTPCKKWRTH